MKKFSFLLASLLLCISACTNNATDTEDLSAKKMLSSGKQFTIYESDAIVRDTALPFDLSARFNEGGEYIVSDSNKYFSSGTWELLENDSKLRLSGFNDGGASDITQIYKNALKIRAELEGKTRYFIFAVPAP